MPNKLISSTSPYLLAHANDPVDWYPWGEAAVAKARAEDKPIHLSVGYHACHWCHVLHHESFQDPVTAAILNDNYVNIKVDREERPDIDAIYMTAVQALTGGGGWPMTVFLTPDGVPFYGGTYYPPEDRHGMPAFRRVLLSIADAYANRRDELLKSGNELTEHIRSATQMQVGGDVNLALLDTAAQALQRQYDSRYGGFGRAPKFPQPTTLEFLLRYATRTHNDTAGAMALTTLHAMAEGGMYDQLGGGFHRYSVDAEWLVPHFEKMLYDNALLARVYIEAYQANGEPFFKRVAEETLDYILRELRHPAGGFYSTQDADSLPAPDAPHKEEGAFFVWTPDEIKAALGSDAMAFSAVYDVTARGNFEGNNILRIKRQPDDVARTLGITPERFADQLARNRATLFAIRAKRPLPNLDDKILTAWNGMAIRAFATAAAAFDRPDYLDAAVAAAEFVFSRLRDGQGRLVRSWRDAGPPTADRRPPLALSAAEGTTDQRTMDDGRWTMDDGRWATGVPTTEGIPHAPGESTTQGVRAGSPRPTDVQTAHSAPPTPDAPTPDVPAGSPRPQDASANNSAILSTTAGTTSEPLSMGSSPSVPPVHPAILSTTAGTNSAPPPTDGSSSTPAPVYPAILSTPAAAPAFLDDHALLADGCLALYHASGDGRWVHEAQSLADTILARFWNQDINGFYDTAQDHEALIVRPRDTGDNATPAGNSAAADLLLRLGALLDRQDYRDRAMAVLAGQAQLMGRYPTGYGRYLAAAEFALNPVREVVIVGDVGEAGTDALLSAVRQPFLPSTVLALLPSAGVPFATPLFAERARVNDQPTAYVCQNYACQLPVTSVEALQVQLPPAVMRG